MENDSLTRCISRQEWLEPMADGLARAVGNAFEAGGETGKKVADFLHGNWLGHPLHPALTNIPIGAWTASLALDIAAAATGERAFDRGADAAMAIGIAGAVASAVTGVADWHTTRGPARRIGLMHAILNSTALALYVTSLGMRKKRRRDAGRALGCLAYGISTTAAYLGGHLVFRDGVGVETEAA